MSAKGQRDPASCPERLRETPFTLPPAKSMRRHKRAELFGSSPCFEAPCRAASSQRGAAGEGFWSVSACLLPVL